MNDLPEVEEPAFEMVSVARGPALGDRAFSIGAIGAAALAGAIIALIIGFVLMESLPALRSLGLSRFLTDPSWHPAEGLYRLTPMLLGTLAVAVGATVIAAPLGVASAIFGRCYAPRPIAWAYRRIIELLAGIPSVVFGLWGLTALVPLIARMQPPGTSLLAAIIVLALMILPTIALTADAAMQAIPNETRQAAAALGLGRMTLVMRVLFPEARRGIGVGVLLALGRAIGETMAVLMVAGNVVQVPAGLFEPVRTVTANIALEMGYATADHRSVLFVAGLMLMAMVGVLVVVTELAGGGDDHG